MYQKILFGELPFNLSAPHCHIDRVDVFTQIFLEEKSCGHTFLSLANARCVSVKAYSAWEKTPKCFCNLFDHIKMGSGFVCCDNVCWVRGSQTVSHSGLLDVYKATDKMSVSLYKQRLLPWPALSKNQLAQALGKHQNFPASLLSTGILGFNLETNYDYSCFSDGASNHDHKMCNFSSSLKKHSTVLNIWLMGWSKGPFTGDAKISPSPHKRLKLQIKCIFRQSGQLIVKGKEKT